MIRINNSFSAQYQPLQKPKTNTSPAFGAGEAEFIETLEKMCKRGWNSHTGESLYARATELDPTHKVLNETLTQIKENKNTEPRILFFIEKQLPEVIGIGGGVELTGTPISKAIDGIIDFFSKKKKA